MIDSVVEVEELTLRPPRADDVAWIYDACQDPEIQRWIPIPSPYRARDAVEFFNGATAGWADHTRFVFVICATETGELLGAVEVRSIDYIAATARIGFWLAREGRGRGAATKAVSGLVRWCAEALGLVELAALAMDGNRASEAVLEMVRCVRPAIKSGKAAPIPL